MDRIEKLYAKYSDICSDVTEVMINTLYEELAGYGVLDESDVDAFAISSEIVSFFVAAYLRGVNETVDENVVLSALTKRVDMILNKEEH